MKLEFSRAHALDLATLKARIADRVRHYDEKHPRYALSEHYRWVGERDARGSYRGGEGAVHLGDTEVTITLELPFFARPFRARIEDFVRREFDAVLGA